MRQQGICYNFPWMSENLLYKTLKPLQFVTARFRFKGDQIENHPHDQSCIERNHSICHTRDGDRWSPSLPLLHTHTHLPLHMLILCSYALIPPFLFFRLMLDLGLWLYHSVFHRMFVNFINVDNSPFTVQI